jgi:hypothetical protein
VNCGSKPAQPNSSGDPILKKKPITKIGLVEWLNVNALSSNPSTAKEKKKSQAQHESQVQHEGVRLTI